MKTQEPKQIHFSCPRYSNLHADQVEGWLHVCRFSRLSSPRVRQDKFATPHCDPDAHNGRSRPLAQHSSNRYGEQAILPGSVRSSTYGPELHQTTPQPQSRLRGSPDQTVHRMTAATPATDP